MGAVMHTEKRYALVGVDADLAREPLATKSDADAAASDAHDEMSQRDRERGIDGRDIDISVEPVEVLVDAFNVVSQRDGEVVIREVDEQTAEAEARRLAGEQADDKIANPIHALIPDETATPPGEPPALVPHEPTPHPGYAVEPAAERIIEPDDQPDLEV